MSVLEADVSNHQFWRSPNSSEGGLHKEVRFSNGSSGARIDLKAHPDLVGRSVVKTNAVDPQRIHREMAGARMLLVHGAYSPWILRPSHFDEEPARIVYPYVEGVDLRTALLTSQLQDDDVVRVAQMLKDIEIARACERTARTPDTVPYGSMQRGEWGDTLARIAQLYKQGILKDVDPESPIVVGEQTYPSLNDVIRRVNGLMSIAPPFVDIGHNDLTQTNVLLTGTVDSPLVIIDHEWAGYADPAESLVRTAKARKTYDLPKEALQELQIDGGVIRMPNPAPHAQQPALFEKTIYDATRQMADRYGDDHFIDRVQLYRAGSYLRECAMSDTRSTPQHGLYAIVEASMAIDEAL